MQNTYKLNEMLHRYSIPEKLRSQFVGTCLLALKNGLDYSTPSLSAAQIRTRIKEVLEDLLNSDIYKAEKLALLNRNVLGDQYIRQLNIVAFREILKYIEDNILPFINDKSTSGQDLLNLFLLLLINILESQIKTKHLLQIILQILCPKLQVSTNTRWSLIRVAVVALFSSCNDTGIR